MPLDFEHYIEVCSVVYIKYEQFEIKFKVNRIPWSGCYKALVCKSARRLIKNCICLYAGLGSTFLIYALALSLGKYCDMLNIFN